MKLEIQIISLFYYLAFGLFYALNFNLFYKYLFYSKLIVKLISNTVFMLIMFFIFAISNTIINKGLIHIYFLLTFVISFIFGNKIFKSLRCKL